MSAPGHPAAELDRTSVRHLGLAVVFTPIAVNAPLGAVLR